MLKPDPTRYPSIVETQSTGAEWIEPDSAEPWTESGDVVAFRSKSDLPTDLALDLRLREILQQARLATAASGAVIALARGEKIVCRASLGDKAPSAGVSLNTRSGLSGACVQTREMQLCDDTLADPRVNAVACRDLGIRSIVVLPVLDGGELWGVLELFSSTPHAFSESDLQTLQALSRKISSTVLEAIQGGSTTQPLGAFSQAPKADSAEPKQVEPEASPAPEIAPAPDQAAVGQQSMEAQIHAQRAEDVQPGKGREDAGPTEEPGHECQQCQHVIKHHADHVSPSDLTTINARGVREPRQHDRRGGRKQFLRRIRRCGAEKFIVRST